MKVYTGPYRSKVEDIITVPPFPVNRQNSLTSAAGVTTVSHDLGTSPGSRTHFDSLYTPNYSQRVREGYLIFCPYSKVEESSSYTPCAYSERMKAGSSGGTAENVYTNCVDGLQHMSAFPLSGLDVGLTLTRAQEEVLTKVFAKAQSPLVDGLVDTSQIRQLFEMFFTLARRLLVLMKNPGAFFRWIKNNSVDKYATARIPGNPHGRLSELAGLWCELRFGWRPLLFSMDGLAHALAEGDDQSSKLVTYRSAEDINISSVKVETSYSTVYSWTSPVTRTVTETLTGSVRGGILIAQNRTLLQKTGFEWANLPFAVWDLVPFSFVFDRFVNLGNWLRALRPVPPSQFGRAWVVKRYVHRKRYTGVYNSCTFSSGSGSSYRYWDRTGGTNVYETVRTVVERGIHTSPPLFPTLKWDWNLFNDLYNAIDVMMLAIQRASRDLRRMDGRRN